MSSRELIEVDKETWDKLDHTMLGEPVYCRVSPHGIEVWPRWPIELFEKNSLYRPKIWID